MTFVFLIAGPANRALQHAHPWELCVQFGMLVGVFLVTVLLLAIRERWRRPPVLRIWDDGSPFRLVVRRIGTGEVLLRAEDASLARRDLRGVPWSRADLQEVDLTAAGLSGADFRVANLQGALLRRADLRGANLTGARLNGARVEGAVFAGANLRGADFVGRGSNRVFWDHDVSQADLRGAFYDGSTRWPWGFVPAEHGCILEEGAAQGLPIPHETAADQVDQLPVPAGRSERPR